MLFIQRGGKKQFAFGTKLIVRRKQFHMKQSFMDEQLPRSVLESCLGIELLSNQLERRFFQKRTKACEIISNKFKMDT